MSCLIVAALVMTSCGPAVEKGGTLRIAGPAGHYNLDPPKITGSMDTEICWAVYDGLVRRMADMSYKPCLATSWESNDDLTEWTFKLRRGVKFHNGDDFDAEDVIYNFTRIVDPEVGSASASQFECVENIVALDDYTVRFELSSANAFFLDALCVHYASLIPKGIDTERLTNEAIGTGPFILEEYVEGEHAIMKKNPDYWDEGLPYLDEVIFLFMPEEATRLAALRVGDIDIEYAPPASEIPMVEDDPNIVVTICATGSYYTLVMDNRVPPFNNKLVRQAFQLATDREMINQAVLFGYGAVCRDHPILPTDPYFAAEYDVPPYDPERARELLVEAGYPDGIEVDLHTMSYYGHDDFAVAFKECAEPAGIRVNVIREPEDTYWGEVWMSVPLCTDYWGGRPPYIAIEITSRSGAPWNEAYYSNLELDALLDEVPSEPDFAKRKAMFARMQEILVDDAPRILAVFTPGFWFTRDYVRGIDAHPLWWFYLHEAWLDK